MYNLLLCATQQTTLRDWNLYSCISETVREQKEGPELPKCQRLDSNLILKYPGLQVTNTSCITGTVPLGYFPKDILQIGGETNRKPGFLTPRQLFSTHSWHHATNTHWLLGLVAVNFHKASGNVQAIIWECILGVITECFVLSCSNSFPDDGTCGCHPNNDMAWDETRNRHSPVLA